MDEREEGEISLDDVSSSEEPVYDWTKNRTITGSRMINHEKQDADQGKENRQHTNGERRPINAVPPLGKIDDLSPIASDEEEVEYVGLPGSSYQLAISLGPARKKKKKKKKKKSVNPRMLTIDDFVSSVDEPTGLLGIDDYDDAIIGRALPAKVERSISPLYKKVSPVKRTTETSWSNTRSSNERYNSSIKYGRSPIRRERSPSPHRRSPRRVVSPRKSQISATDHRHVQYKTARESHDQSRSTVLSKIRNSEALGGIAGKNHKETSLKEKLSNILKGQSESKENIDNFETDEQVRTKTIKSEFDDDNNEDDDELLLRKLALDTQITRNDQQSNEENEKNDELSSKGHINNSDDDEEDLKLRMIALKSAMMNKYQARVKQGKRPQKPNDNDESPFDFLDELDDDDESEKFHSDDENHLPSTTTNSTAPLPDMELDSDVEREKDSSQPYSPSDEIAERTIAETDYPDMSLADTTIDTHNDESQCQTNPIITNASYLAKTAQPEPNLRSNDTTTYTTTPYLHVNRQIEQNTRINETYLHKNPDQHLRTNEPYLQTTPHYEPPVRPDTSYFVNFPPQPVPAVDVPFFHTPSVTPPAPPPPIISDAYFEPFMYPPQPVPCPPAPLELTNPLGLDGYPIPNPLIPMRDPRLRRQLVGMGAEPPPVFNSQLPLSHLQNVPVPESTAPAIVSAMRKPSARPALSTELSNLISVPLTHNAPVLLQKTPTVPIATVPATIAKPLNSNKTNSIDDDIRNDVLRDLAEYTGEPLYIQSIDDTTKDTNKIPTVVNKKLVPAPILKTNKQLQQPLPTKKIDTEPAFKSAEMQPVNAQPTKSNTEFKPIKLQAVAKNTQITPTSVSAFNNSLNADASPVFDDKNSKMNDNHVTIDKSISNVTNPSITKSSTMTMNEPKKKGRRSKTPKLNGDVTRKTSNVHDKNKTKVAEKKTSKSNSEKDKNIERKSRKSMGIPKKSTVTHTETDNLTKKSETKRNRSKSISRNDKKSDENSKSKANINDSAKQKKDSITKSTKTKVTGKSDGQSRRTSDEKRSDDKRRRSSVDEDEEELRALLLATMSKRSKTVDAAAAATPTAQNSVTKVVASEQNKLTNTKVPSVNTNTAAANKLKVNPTATSANVNVKKRPNNTEIPEPTVKVAKKMTVADRTQEIIDATIRKKIAMNEMTLAELLAQQQLKSARNSSKIPSTTDNSSPKTSVSKRQERLVIRLGEDSDSDTEDEKVALTSVNAAPSTEATSTLGLDIEKSVEAFLRAQREKQESGAAINKTTTPASKTKNVTTAATPLAVRHLPVSKQEEYRRLKQVIAEREKLKKEAAEKKSLIAAKAVSVGPASPATTVEAPTKSLLQKAPQVSANVVNVPLKISKEEPNQTVQHNVQSTAPQTAQIHTQSTAAIVPVTIKSDVNDETLPLIIPNIPIKADPEGPIPSSIIDNSKSHANDSSTSNSALLESMEHFTIRITNAPMDDGKSVREVIIPTVATPPLAPEFRILTAQQFNNIKVEPGENTTEKTVVNGSTVDSNNIPSSTPLPTVVPKVEPGLESPAKATINIPETSGKSPDTKLIITVPNDTTVKTESDEPTMIFDDITNRTVQETVEKASISEAREPSKMDIQQFRAQMNSEVQTGLERFATLPSDEQQAEFDLRQRQLVQQRYNVIENLTVMSEDLQQYDVKLEIEQNFAAEVKRLRLELKLAEERLQQQRNEIASDTARMSRNHVRINRGQLECRKYKALCEGMGALLVGPTYQVPSTGDQEMLERMKEVGIQTQKMKKVPPVESPQQQQQQQQQQQEQQENSKNMIKSENIPTKNPAIATSTNSIAEANQLPIVSIKSEPLDDDDNTMTTAGMPGNSVNPPTIEDEKSTATSYESVLMAFNAQRHMDPNGVLCPYELAGTCNDEACRYSHLDAARR